MRISECIASCVIAGAAILAVAPAFAFEGTTPGGLSSAGLPPVGLAAPTAVPVPPLPVAVPNGTAAAKAAVPSSNSLSTLQYAAEGGHPIAQWKLGRMYATGEGVDRDDLRAFDYFSRIANQHAEDSPSAPQAQIVANAFVALGRYYRDGIPNTRVRIDRERAREMFHYAASYFGNADAQYNLARMYLDGVGSQRDPKYAARWLAQAAQKGQFQAQALLGQMLFNGDLLPRQVARGLMWLTLARDNAGPDEVWINDVYNSALKRASEDDRAMAGRMLERWVQGRRD
ncbi:exopolysaccharide production negative regulator [Afipia sp. P52-10]|jgi:TPR repeat protein|uniref:tetratricopeptide repeat protein n=1 Tax=Afipia sp. P52-10 TaxID=1429916 RepID=UPI0003DF37F1|nr:tetratricopeptide repeat protein [Afipia sp. P52-10]ETR75262.1 exopolysaccharide production negative regulator [Afipia sp. P52-10]